jgi:DNA-binding beta-propeller fold protein YncE
MRQTITIISTAVIILWTASALHAESGFGPPFISSDDFSVPAGLAVDPTNGRVLVADTGHHEIKFAAIADLQTGPVWTSFGYVADRDLPEALHMPQGIAVDSAGNAYVADTLKGEVQLYRYTAGSYAYDANFAADTRNTVDGVDIRLPRDIAVGGLDDHIYLLDSGNNRVLVAHGPDDRSWEVFHQNGAWDNPYGLDVTPDGSVFIADTTNSRIIRVQAGVETLFGGYGSGAGQLRHPRDVAVAADGRMFVADTHNYRITILMADGSADTTLGAAPRFTGLEKSAVDAAGRIYGLDSSQNRLTTYFGPGLAPPFDAYIRDYPLDSGAAATPDSIDIVSPDIVVRHAPDIDPHAAMADGGLQGYASQQPRYGQNNYIYIAVHNRGPQEITGTRVALHYADPNSPLDYPDDWLNDRFYESYASELTNTPGNSVTVPYIAPRNGTDGVAVVGPVIWRPLPAFGISGLGKYLLMAAIEHPDDLSTAAPGLGFVRQNNNVAAAPQMAAQGTVPVGRQDVLVIRVNFPDMDHEIDLPTITNRIQQADAWLNEVTYGQVGLYPTYRGPVTLAHPATYYHDASRTLLIEMATDVMARLLADEAGLLQGPSAGPEDDIDRIAIFINDPTYREDWSTTSTWPYDLPDSAGTVDLSVSVFGPAATNHEVTHGLCHQFGLEDLYQYENVIEFPSEYLPNGWDNMAQPVNGVHPLTWSKELAGWVTAGGGKIVYIQRPSAGDPPLEFTDPINLKFQSILKRGDIGAVAIGLTEGVTSFEEEKFFMWVEARSPDLGNADAAVPGKGVIVYKAHKEIQQGQGPVLICDSNPGTPGVEAIVPVGGSVESTEGLGITVRVESELADDDGYLVNVRYAPSDIQYNVYVETGTPHWTSPDIWIDNQRDGGAFTPYDAAAQRLLEDPVDENPIEGEDNRIFARVHNEGPGAAYNVRVIYKISAPYHTVGGHGDFDLFGHVIINEIPGGEYKDVFMQWRPLTNDQHNCVMIDLADLVNDTDSTDNHAQQNFTVMESSSASPYDETQFSFHITNPFDQDQLIYLRADGVPAGWDWQLTPGSHLFQPREKITGTLKLLPPESASGCTNHEIYVTSWVPGGDTLNNLGGTTINIGLREKTGINARTSLADCQKLMNRRTKAVMVIDPGAHPKQCAAISVSGCTNPPRPDETVTINYRDPAGNPIYTTVSTDEQGCYTDVHLVVEGGPWTVHARYPGSRCFGSAETILDVNVPLPQTGDQDGDGLADEDEVQGDDDNDHIPNHLDMDSDNDGLPDGQEQEPAGNPDQDSLVNVVDPDSDNDGILDGEDPLPYTPGDGGCNPQMVRLWYILAAIAILLAAILYFRAYRMKKPWLGLIAALLLCAIGIAGILLCSQLLGKSGIILIIIGVVMFLFVFRW